MSTYDYLFKVVIIGDEGLFLKSCLDYTSIFEDCNRYSLGVDFGIICVNVNDQRIKLQIWNPIIRDRFACIRHLYYRGASSTILVTEQDCISNLDPLIYEIVDNLPPIPIHLVIGCTSQFVKELKDHKDILIELGLTSPINTLSHPRDIYYHVSQTFLSQNTSPNQTINLNLLPNDNTFPLPSHNVQKDVEGCLIFLEEALNCLQDWATLCLQREQQKKLDQIARKQQEAIFYDLIESFEIKIDEKRNCASVQNRFGLFYINVQSSDVEFIPNECFSCKKQCQNARQSLCIVSQSKGWSSSGLSQDHLLTLSKIFAIMNEQLPRHVWDQILGHRALTPEGCNTSSTITNMIPPPLPDPLPETPTIGELRDAMLQELIRLKHIMRGEV